MVVSVNNYTCLNSLSLFLYFKICIHLHGSVLKTKQWNNFSRFWRAKVCLFYMVSPEKKGKYHSWFSIMGPFSYLWRQNSSWILPSFWTSLIDTQELDDNIYFAYMLITLCLFFYVLHIYIHITFNNLIICSVCWDYGISMGFTIYTTKSFVKRWIHYSYWYLNQIYGFQI